MDHEAWVRGAVESDEAEALTSHLVSFRSYPGEEGPVQRAVAGWLTENGIPAELRATGEADRPNVIARVENGAGPTLLLNGHVDTVLAAQGWSSDPWQPRREGDRLYGLGACDMKSGVAAAMLATRTLAQARDRWRGTVLFTSVVDEEAYSLGARALVAAGVQADACIVTESSFTWPCLGSIGKILVRVNVTGKAAHATWPEQGINAAVEAARFVARLEEVAFQQHPRMTASQCVLGFASGNEQYVITVPERASVIINRMIVPGEDEESVVAELRRLADSLHSPARFEFVIEPPYYPPWEIAPDHPLVAQFAHAYVAETGHAPAFDYHGFGDANLLSAELGLPTIQFGPHGGNFHQADEWVEVPSIAATVRVLLRVACQVLA